MPLRRVLVLLLLVAVTAVTAVPAAAHDANSPPDAGHNWLPREGWVFQHWVPYDEDRLLRELGVDRARLWCWLAADHRTLAGLAQDQGRDWRRVAATLERPWRTRVSSARLGELRSRIRRTFTQGHLGQHLFFHYFHGVGLPTRAPEIFGVSREEFIRLRKVVGLTPIEIGARNGHPAARVRADVVRVLRTAARRAVETDSSPPRQAAKMLALQLADLDRWLNRPRPPHDPDSLFDRWGGNGPHERGSTAVAPEHGDGRSCSTAPADVGSTHEED